MSQARRRWRPPRVSTTLLFVAALLGIAGLLFAVLGAHSLTQVMVGETSSGRHYRVAQRRTGTMVQLYGIWTVLLPVATIVILGFIGALLRVDRRHVGLPWALAVTLSVALVVSGLAAAFALTVALALSLPGLLACAACAAQRADPR